MKTGRRRLAPSLARRKAAASAPPAATCRATPRSGSTLLCEGLKATGVAGRPEEYEAALSAALDRHAAASWKAKRAVDRYPRAGVWALRAPGVFDAITSLLRGELAHPADAPRIAQPPLRILSRLARHAT